MNNSLKKGSFNRFLGICLLALIGITQIHTAKASDQYDNLRQNWYDYLTGGNEFEPIGTELQAKVGEIASNALKYWNSMNKNEQRTSIWDDLNSQTIDKNCQNTYARLREMALAYRISGSSLKDNAALRHDIISALDWMYTHRYNENTKQEVNWWFWWFGIPPLLSDCTILMYEHLTPVQVSNYMKGIDLFCHLPMVHSGANRMWECKVIGMRGIIKKDSISIAAARDGMAGLFEYVTKGNGFYIDGSCIQHAAYAYTGGYGISLLQDMSEMMYLLSGSKWDTTNPSAQNVFKWVYDSFEPIMYKGGIMTMVQGREIARQSSQEHKVGHKVINAVLLLAQAASPADARAFKSMIKEWISKDSYRNYFTDTPLFQYTLAKNIMNDPGIAPRGDLISYRQYAGMDRAVVHRPGYSYGISMFSKRIANYEQINDENYKAWHAGSGMTYLYNELTQFDDNFWPTVNSYRLPGTTVVSNTTEPAGKRGTKNWVGGTDMLGKYGVTGMEYKSVSQTLTAKKSWFMFDDEIVALGAGITSTDNKPVETIIENRKLNRSGSNKLIINGKTISSSTGWSETLKDTKWAYLRGNEDRTSTGYVFPVQASINGLRERRTDNWNSVNKFGDTTQIVRNYLSLSFDHGANPINGTYSYILLPNKSNAQVKKYAGKPDITFLENSADAQGVRENSLKITGVNYWNNIEKRVDFISCNKKASVMVMESSEGDKNYLEISISDPTQSNSGTIDIELHQKALSIVANDPDIIVAQLNPVIKLSVNVKNSAGKAYKAKFSMK